MKKGILLPIFCILTGMSRLYTGVLYLIAISYAYAVYGHIRIPYMYVYVYRTKAYG
jgi:hypothetical protein